MPKISPDLERSSYTIPEFGARHHISRGTIYNQIAAGELDTIKIGAARRITVKAEIQWLERKLAKTSGGWQ